VARNSGKLFGHESDLSEIKWREKQESTRDRLLQGVRSGARQSRNQGCCQNEKRNWRNTFEKINERSHENNSIDSSYDHEWSKL